jgi:hypothetical protein
MANNKRPAFLTMTVDGGQWSALYPNFLTPWDRAPVYSENEVELAPKPI